MENANKTYNTISYDGILWIEYEALNAIRSERNQLKIDVSVLAERLAGKNREIELLLEKIDLLKK